MPEYFINQDVWVDGNRVPVKNVTFSDKKGENGIHFSPCVYAHITAQAAPVVVSVTNVSRKITYPSGAWIEIDYQNEQYTVSREHGVGGILEEMAQMILAGFEGCKKFVDLVAKVNPEVEVSLTTVTNSKGATMEIPADNLQDYVLQVFDKEPEKFIELKKFMHTCRKTKNCDCLEVALRNEHCARVDAQVAKSLASREHWQVAMYG